MYIRGKMVLLRAIEETDLPILQEMINDPELENCVVGWSWPVSLAGQKAWYLENLKSTTNQRFIIEYENEAMGLIVLSDIDWKNRKATTGIKLSRQCPKGKGIGTDAVMALERYSFNELNLNRLEGSWFPENIASASLHKKCGWKEEGLQRKAIFKNGQYQDLVIVGCLKQDYEEVVSASKYWN